MLLVPSPILARSNRSDEAAGHLASLDAAAERGRNEGWTGLVALDGADGAAGGMCVNCKMQSWSLLAEVQQGDLSLLGAEVGRRILCALDPGDWRVTDRVPMTSPCA